MKWHFVNSSNIYRISHVQEQLALFVEFRSGLVYVYLNVPETLFTGLLEAESHGKYFAQHIRSPYSGVPVADTTRRQVGVSQEQLEQQLVDSIAIVQQFPNKFKNLGFH